MPNSFYLFYFYFYYVTVFSNRLVDTSGGILSQLPILRFIFPDLSGYNSLMFILTKLWSFLNDEINQHVLNLPADEPRDLIDAFLMEISRNNSDNSQFNRELLFIKPKFLFLGLTSASMSITCVTYNYLGEELLILCLDLFLAGSETTSNTLSTAMIYLALNPEQLPILQQELRRVVGQDRPPSAADRSSLPSIEAFLAEVN